MTNPAFKCVSVHIIFFFSSRRRHTRLQGDWSSDVCSSDLGIFDRAKAAGACVSITDVPEEAIAGVQVVNPDVWASMGQEEEAEARRNAFRGYTVDRDLMQLADSKAIFLHCLPAHRGEEVATEVIEGPQSRVWDEAENRLHVQKALLATLMG